MSTQIEGPYRTTSGAPCDESRPVGLNRPPGETILIVEDDRHLRRVLVRHLEDCGYRLYTADVGRHGLIEIGRRQPDLVIVDLTLPDMDGVALISDLRGWSSTPVLVLSGRLQDIDKITALNAGADDYLSKPFSFGELEARIRAALRRGRSNGALVSEIHVGDLTIDFRRRVVTVAGQRVHLAPIEFNLLAILAKNGGRMTSHRQLLLAVWGPSHVHDTHYLRVHISNLRKKIETQVGNPRYIITDPTIGYRLAMDDAADSPKRLA